MTLIMCDVDSTLYDADALFSELANEAGIDWPDRDYEWKSNTEVFHYSGKHVSVDELKKVFRKAHSEEYVSKNIPYEHSVEVISKLAKRATIAFISDRNTQQTETLRKWLSDHGFLSGGEVVEATSDKREWMKYHTPDFVIDDRVRTLLFARYELGAQCFSLKHNHNMNLRGEAPGINICRNWLEIGDGILKEL